jgi:2-polyprenyl-3-methyl-5-hydroxy-6-metoxy-1,4-benzoquinol methylase
LNAEKADLAFLGRFDVVLMLALIEHLSEPAELIRKVKALLQNGGRIILTTPQPRGEWALKMGSLVGLCSRESQTEHHALLGREELCRLAARCGFHDILYRSFLFGMNQLLILRA